MKLKFIKERLHKHGWKYAFTIFDAKYGLGKIESIFSSNWFNPFATVWLNFRSFSFIQALHLPVFVYGRPKLRCLSGRMKIEGAISMGMIVFNKVRMMAPGLMTEQSELLNQGTIIFEGGGEIGTGNKIVTYLGAEIRIGAEFKIQEQVNIGCMKSIDIGKCTWIVHRCQVFDTNYHYIADINRGIISNAIHPIVIGKYCWIGNTTTITGGAKIPNYTIVASNSLVNNHINDIPENSIVGGIPAKLISTGYRRVYNKELENKCRIFYQNHESSEYLLSEKITPDIISGI